MSNNSDAQSNIVEIPCPYCSGTIYSNVSKCKHCGEWLNDIQEHIEKIVEKQQEINKKQAEQEAGKIVLSLIVSVVFSYFLFFYDIGISNAGGEEWVGFIFISIFGTGVLSGATKISM